MADDAKALQGKALALSENRLAIARDEGDQMIGTGLPRNFAAVGCQNI
jgi:hypothetical protein